MTDAAPAGPVESWSPSSILAGIGNAVDRFAGRSSIADQAPLGNAAVFEHALAEELLRAGDADLLDGAFDLQNGAVLSRAGETQRASGTVERYDADGPHLADHVGQTTAAGPYWRVGFDAGAGDACRSGGDDHADRGLDGRDRTAFWIGDRITAPAVSLISTLDDLDQPAAESSPAGRIFFNGDGRPIMLPPDDFEQPEGMAAYDAFPGIGDLVILPDGAVLAYDPWTARADGVSLDADPPLA